MITSKSIQTEVDACFLYKVLADNEKDPEVASIFRQMSEIENGHAISFLTKNNQDISSMPGPSKRARILKTIGSILGYDYVLGVLLDTEKSLSASIINARKKSKTEPSLSDTAHVKILENVIIKSGMPVVNLARFEKRHRSVGGNALRAAVLGGNDGLVSNFSLVMGVAGATGGQKEVMLAGFAGMLAGALSMAMGEWVSVKSSKELYENQMDIEMEELENNPQAEEKELALIYKAKGISGEESERIAREVISDKSHAHQVLVKEELGINSEDLKSSPGEAAMTSFFLFAFGAVIPLIPFFFMTGASAIILSCCLSAMGLMLIGSSITLFTGRNAWFSGFRQVLFGLSAAAVTFLIGKLIGIA
ncbi:MAG: VIT1/CCC1 transporter family protein, partial [Bacteroidota bacterium]|nr:VIT1/CCC1 transporter family protein [Bacteroidota bacterium]